MHMVVGVGKAVSWGNHGTGKGKEQMAASSSRNQNNSHGGGVRTWGGGRYRCANQLCTPDKIACVVGGVVGGKGCGVQNKEAGITNEGRNAQAGVCCGRCVNGMGV